MSRSHTYFTRRNVVFGCQFLTTPTTFTWGAQLFFIFLYLKIKAENNIYWLLCCTNMYTTSTTMKKNICIIHCIICRHDTVFLTCYDCSHVCVHFIFMIYSENSRFHPVAVLLILCLFCHYTLFVQLLVNKSIKSIKSSFFLFTHTVWKNNFTRLV